MLERKQIENMIYAVRFVSLLPGVDAMIDLSQDLKSELFMFL